MGSSSGTAPAAGSPTTPEGLGEPELRPEGGDAPQDVSIDGASPDGAVAPEESGRRRLLALLGAGGVGALASLLSSKEARAAHGGDNVFHLGEYNNAPVGSFDGAPHHTILDAPSPEGALKVINGGSGPAIQAEGGGGGVFATEKDSGQAAVSGVSNDEGIGDGSGMGVFGQSGSGVGVTGHADSGLGAQFHSNTGAAIQADGPVGIAVDRADSAALFASQEGPGAGGIAGESRAGGIAVEGVVYPTEEELEFEDQKAGYGVRGIASLPEGYGNGPGTGVHGQSGSGNGVLGTTTGPGNAVTAASWGDDGIDWSLGPALRVEGRSLFATAGAGEIPAGQNSVTIENEAVTGGSHISVMLTGDPGNRQVHWVERNPGTGFTVHLTSAPPPQRPATPFTYFIVEPAP